MTSIRDAATRAVLPPHRQGPRGGGGPAPAAVEAQGVQPTTMRPGDLLQEAVAGLFARPGRMWLTILGTVIGITALVATLGLSRTASHQIIGRFDELAATQVLVSSLPSAEGEPTNNLPWRASAQVTGLNGVVAAGTLSLVDVGKDLVTARPLADPRERTRFKLAVQAASTDLYTAIRAQLREGRLPDAGHSLREDRVAVLGAHAAERLGLSSVAGLPAVAIGDQVFLVVGILQTVERQHNLLNSVIIPEGTARALYRLRSPQTLVVETEVGAAALLAKQVPLLLRPDAPQGLKVTSPEEPQRARAGVSSDLDALFLMLGGVSLLVGAIGIANVTLVSVMERTGEIGLRRALGASRRHIASQFLLESASMGVVGGVLGASAGMLVVVGVTASQSWTPVVDPWVPLLAPLVGGLTGLVAGFYPALRAARMEPVDALRAGT